MSSSKRNSALAVFSLALLFVLSFVASVNALSSIPLCFFKSLTQLDCPGCGLTRSFISISHGHFLEALRFNILGPFVYGYFLLYLLKHSLKLLSSPYGNFSWLPPPWFQFSFAALLLGQWIFKLARELL